MWHGCAGDGALGQRRASCKTVTEQYQERQVGRRAWWHAAWLTRMIGYLAVNLFKGVIYLERRRIVLEERCPISSGDGNRNAIVVQTLLLDDSRMGPILRGALAQPWAHFLDVAF
ncbi:hypothetical protein EVAR_46037_1 [Eumeta japonica]|uniref:Uncharacterized protein n=1 Tax=Eumeta variegata TaxID=151549 RepID=A0A4C1XF06_EUMVA|nr:hypothetical protein EVAR_46037_1 [Eumeta japonica]